MLVDINFDRLQPSARARPEPDPELRTWSREDGQVRLGSGVTYHELIADLVGRPTWAGHGRPHRGLAADPQPGHDRRAISARRHRPATATRLLWPSGADVEVASVRGSRTVPISDFFLGPKHSVLGRRRADRRRVGAGRARARRCSRRSARETPWSSPCARSPWPCDPRSAGVGTGIGSAGPVPLQAHAAEQFLDGHLDETGVWESRAPLGDVVDRFGELVGGRRPADRRRAGTAPPTAGTPSRSWAGDRCRGAGRTTGGTDVRASCTVNGNAASVDGVERPESLLQLLRDHVGLTGTKNACEQGECGSCAVYLDGDARVLVPGAGRADRRSRDHDRRRVWRPATSSTRSSRRSSRRAPSSAGSAPRASSSPPTTYWPGVADPDDDEIREALAGNLCRCTGYQKIIDAVHLAARR